ncbi:MAG: hypothetical protein WC580_02240 [Agrococcus sp.]
MRPARSAAVAAALVAVTAMSGCVIPAPLLATDIRLPRQPPSQPPQPSSRPQIEIEPVQPDAPLTTTDETIADTGELYAGSRGETVDGYLPDAPLDLVLDPTRGAARVAPGIAMPPHDGGDELLAGTPHAAGSNLLLTTVGRLVLETDEAGYICSGTVINSDSGLIVVTAAHCIFDDDTRDYYDRITFEPGYERGTAPFGTWEAEEWWVPSQYLESNERYLDGVDDDGWTGFDFGFIRFAPQGGTTLEEAVGGQGVSFTAETNGAVIAGYPGNAPFDAEVLRYCAEDDLGYGAGGDPNYGADCAMGDGASGSGFVSNLDPATGAGHITAVYSNGGESGAYGPPLGVTAYNGLRSLDR